MKPLIVANWKMNPSTLSEANKIFDAVRDGIKKEKKVEVVICPPFVYLEGLRRDSKLKIGAQDCFWEKTGAFTGEISADMLGRLGCRYVIIGHSERRNCFKESDLMINKKIKAALESKLKPILCVGETKQEKNKRKFSTIIGVQIDKAFKKIPQVQISDVIIAYEPIWAIGTGKACPPAQAQIISFFIRKIVTRLYGRNKAEKIPVLYGGSVNRNNALDYLKKSEMKGLLIGGASLKAEEFVGIIKDISNL